MLRTITDYFVEYGTRTRVTLAERFDVLLVSAAAGGVTITVQEEGDQSKMAFWFHVLVAPCQIDQERSLHMIGSAMGVQGSMHVFYEIPTEEVP
jgi:hypothetical protein